MRILLTLLLSSLMNTLLCGQPSTEIYLCTMQFGQEGFLFTDLKNISNNPGYDNQPHFLNDTLLAYARTHNGQTDIAQYQVLQEETAFVHPSTEGGEYSPQPIPASSDLAAVRLDPDGKQRLYRYSITNQENSVLIPEKEIAYYAFINENELLASVLGLNQLNLEHISLQSGISTPMVTNSGRSIQRIPSTEMLSYTILNEQKNFDIYQYDPQTKESYFVCQLPIGVQDYVWYEDYKIMIGSGARLFIYDLFGVGEWQEIANLKEYGFENITRLAISPDNRFLAFAAEPTIDK